MFFIPFPLVVAEIFIFIFSVDHWGFWNTLGLYLLPCFLGFLIVSTVGRMALMTLQSTMMKGQLPAARILHTGAIFLSGILFLVPSFFARVVAIALFLPGLRHLAVWRFKVFIAKKLAQGAASFNFNGPFGFGAGTNMGGFRYYEYRSSDEGFETSAEREVSETNVLDVTPLKIVHEAKKDDGTSE